MKKTYLKPEVEKVAFAPEEFLMTSGMTGGGGIGGDGPNAQSMDIKDAYQIIP